MNLFKIFKHELEISFDKKEIAKQNGFFFCPTLKSWCINENNESFDEMMRLYKRTYLKNIYKNKDLYKKHGAKWDPLVKSWYTYRSNEALTEYFN